MLLLLFPHQRSYDRVLPSLRSQFRLSGAHRHRPLSLSTSFPFVQQRYGSPRCNMSSKFVFAANIYYDKIGSFKDYKLKTIEYNTDHSMSSLKSICTVFSNCVISSHLCVNNQFSSKAKNSMSTVYLVLHLRISPSTSFCVVFNWLC